MSVIQDIAITDRIGASEYPRELVLSTPPRAIKALSKIVSVVPNTSSSVGQNQTVQFQIPQRNMMRSHSCFLKFKFTPTTTANYSFAGSAGSCASLINSIQLTAGSQVLENLLNYHVFHNNVVLAHGSSAEGLGVEAICANSYLPQQFSGNTQGQVSSTGAQLLANANQSNTPQRTSMYLSMPVYAGLICNNNNTAIPLFAIQNGLQLTIQTNPITKAVYSEGAGFTDYSLSEFELFYTEIEPDMAYKAEVLGSLAQGKKIIIEADSYLNTVVAGSTALRQMFSVNMTSLNAVLWGVVKNTDTVNTSKWFESPATGPSSEANDYANTRREVFLDNVSVYNSSNQLNLDAINYRLVQEALCGSITDKAVSPFIQGQGVVGANPAATVQWNGSYRNQAYLQAIPCQNFVSDDVSMRGQSVGQVSVSFQCPYVSTSDTYYFYFLHSYLATIDGTMSVQKLM